MQNVILYHWIIWIGKENSILPISRILGVNEAVILVFKMLHVGYI